MDERPSFTARLSRRRFFRLGAWSAAAVSLGRRAWGAGAPGAESGNVTAASAAAPKPLGVALCGLGAYATGQLAPALQQTRNCKLVGVVTGSPTTKGVRWARQYGFPDKNIYSYDTMAKLADNADIDLVYVVTPNALHVDSVVAAAKAGKHVITEKPMAATVAQCDTMLAACRAAKRTLAVGYRLRYDPYHQEMMRLAADKDFGPFTKIAGENGFTLNGQQWRIDKQLAGGGPLMDMGIYVVHAACMAANADPVAVTAKERPKQRPQFFTQVEESLDWTMEFPGGARATCFTSYNDNVGHFRAEGPHGWIEMAPAFYYNGMKVNTSKGPLDFGPDVNQQARHMDGIAQCVRDGKETPVPGELGRRDLVILEGIYKSAANGGQRVELSYKEPAA